MNKRFVSVLVFAFAVSGLVALLFYRYFSSRLNAAEPKAVATTQVFVAARNLGVGTLLRDADVTLSPWAGAVPQGAVLKKEDLVGRGVVSSIFQGEPMLEARLAPKGAGAGLAATIPPGMRAVAIRVNEIIGVAGFVLPGMRVDVLIAGTSPGLPQNLGTLSKTLLQNIEVLSAGQNIQKDAEGKPVSVPVVNLLVTPEQAETLSLASTETKIQLVLRNPLDQQIAQTPGTAVTNLFLGQKYGIPTAEAPKPKVRAAARPVVMQAARKDPPIVVEVIQGATRNSVSFKEEAR
ncbi:MAG: Flp pilus assembly protein CpaB [Acidobacteriota bacterium]